MMICWFAKIKCWFYYEIHFLRRATPRFKEFEDWSVSSFVKLASVSCVAPEVLHTTRKPSTRKYEPHFQANYSFSEEAISSAEFPEPFAWHLNMHTLRTWCAYVDMTVCVAGDWKMRTRALSVDEREADEFWKHDNLRICSLLASNFFLICEEVEKWIAFQLRHQKRGFLWATVQFVGERAKTQREGGSNDKSAR